MKYFVALVILVCVGCQQPWSDKNKSEWLSGCMSSAVREMPSDTARIYCTCLLQKVVARYPDASDAQYIRYDTTVRQLARECRKSSGADGGKR